MSRRKTKGKKKKQKYLKINIIYVYIFALFITAFLTSWVYGLSQKYIGSDTLLAPLDLNPFIFILVFSGGIISLLVARIIKGGFSINPNQIDPNDL